MTVCHSLPCSIDHSGRASVDTYFRPTKISDDGHLAATFRGRGLLAPPPTPVRGHVIQANGTIEGKFTEMVEWHHTHLPDAIPRETKLKIATDWIEVAAAVHAPLD